jgi:hypothetical protein
MEIKNAGHPRGMSGSTKNGKWKSDQRIPRESGMHSLMKLAAVEIFLKIQRTTTGDAVTNPSIREKL